MSTFPSGSRKKAMWQTPVSIVSPMNSTPACSSPRRAATTSRTRSAIPAVFGSNRSPSTPGCQSPSVTFDVRTHRANPGSAPVQASRRRSVGHARCPGWEPRRRRPARRRSSQTDCRSDCRSVSEGIRRAMVSTLREVAHSTWVEGAGRAGLVAKGASYVLVAILAIQVAVGAGGEPADRQGALDAVAGEPLGWLALLLLAVGFAGYGLWRFAQALFDRDREGTDVTGLGKRATDFAKGVLYVGFAALSVSLVAGGE